VSDGERQLSSMATTGPVPARRHHACNLLLRFPSAGCALGWPPWVLVPWWRWSHTWTRAGWLGAHKRKLLRVCWVVVRSRANASFCGAPCVHCCSCFYFWCCWRYSTCSQCLPESAQAAPATRHPAVVATSA